MEAVTFMLPPQTRLAAHTQAAMFQATVFGVSFEDRQDFLGHRSGRFTTHYSAAELSRLIEAFNAVCEQDSEKPELVVLRRLSSA